MLYSILRPLAHAVAKVLFRVGVSGREHIPATGPVLLVGNHSSFLDPPLVGAVITRHLTYMAKAELFKVPFLGALISRVNAKPVRREGGYAAALRVALRTLQEGGALVMFPEGTRGPEGTLREPKPGAAMLAVMSGATVVPAYIEGSGRAWPRGQALPKPVKIRIRFGAPLTFARRAADGSKTDYEMVGREMMAAIGRLKDGPAPSGTTAATGAPARSGARAGVR